MDSASPTNAPCGAKDQKTTIGAGRAWAPVVLLLLLLPITEGCVANHAFPQDAALDLPSLVNELETRPEDEEALFDLTYLPLLHLNLQTFTEHNKSSSYPEGHQFFSIRSWLPLFLVVDGDIEFFDAKHAAYERNEFIAILWGLWAQNEMTIQTAHGERIERHGRLFWIFDWKNSVEYTQP